MGSKSIFPRTVSDTKACWYLIALFQKRGLDGCCRGEEVPLGPKSLRRKEREWLAFSEAGNTSFTGNRRERRHRRTEAPPFWLCSGVPLTARLFLIPIL